MTARLSVIKKRLLIFDKKTILLAVLFSSFCYLVSADEGLVQTAPNVEDIKKSLTLLLGIIAIPVIIGGFFVARSIYRNTIGKKFQTTLLEDFKKVAEGYEKAGKYVSAAVIYEKRLKDIKKAVVLYEKGGDLRKAAELYSILGMSEKTKEMHIKDGNIDAAAQVLLSDGKFEEAAKMYAKAGKKIDAAIALEKAGHMLAASKAYREAGEYRKAAELLEGEGMTKEAVEMFGVSLRDKEMNAENVQDFYTYALKLEKINDKKKAVEVYKAIDAFNPTYIDVRERLHALTVSPERERDLEGKVTLRGFMKNGRIEPKLCLKLWLQILKVLQDEYKKGRKYGLITPENILFDSNNNVSFLKGKPTSAYISPEQSRGASADLGSDIYSLGVVLYEMLTGGIDGLGSQSVAEIDPEIPSWLDDLVIKCIKKVKEDRYQSIDEIFTDIKVLSKSKKEQTE